MKTEIFAGVACGIALLTLTMTSCSNEPGEDAQTLKEQTLQTANEQFVSKTVLPTYKALADKALLLQAALEELQRNTTDANVNNACALWKEARQYWEWSEAFLFGAASKYAIDPHIDTWPLDKTALDNLLNSGDFIADPESTIANLNNGLVGFHGLEYIIFRSGACRAASAITSKELGYAVAVAKDLSLSCCRLEAAWAGIDNITAEKRAILEDAEMEPEDDFGEQMRLCGKAGSLWKSVASGSEQIIEGCKDITDEVGAQKIGKPHTGEDVNYIESPHAYNSIQDFHDNIVSVRNAYFGGMGATTAQSGSISAYIRSVNQAADQAVVDAIADCLAKIDAMPKPFVLNYRDAAVTAAIAACETLNDALEAARKVLVND